MPTRSKRPVYEWLAARKKRKTVTDEIRTLKRSVALNRPEAKHHQTLVTGPLASGAISYAECTYIQHGDTQTDRSGQQVRLTTIQYSLASFTAAAAAAGLDVYVVTVRDASHTPNIADFTGSPGGFPNRETYIAWKQHITNGDDNNGNIIATHTWPNGMRAHFSGSAFTSCNRNRTYVIVKNSTGSSQNFSLNVRTWFTDA